MEPLSAIWHFAGAVAPPILHLLLRARLRRGKEIAERLPERRGIDATPRPPGRLIWLHAASVGETVSLLPVLRALTRRAPDATILVTTGSVTSAALLTGRLGELGIAGVIHRFIPLDVPRWVARFLDHWRPTAAAFVESELWPNLLAACAARRLPLLLLNARMSEKSFSAWRRAPGLARRALSAFRQVQARSTLDAERLRRLGARDVTTPGDLKFAADKLPVDEAELARLQHRLRGRPCWLAASTHEGEEKIVLASHRALLTRYPDLLTILAPRHPERATAVAALATDLTLTRRSLGENPPEQAGIWLIDTLGELGLFYRLAGIAFIGNSLVAGGGHNPLEPARLDCAIATGPHTANFADAMAALAAVDALELVTDGDDLTAWINRMLSDPVERTKQASAARGAADRVGELPTQCADALLALCPSG